MNLHKAGEKDRSDFQNRIDCSHFPALTTSRYIQGDVSDSLLTILLIPSPMKIISALILVSAALVSGCAYNVSPYGASVKNVETLKSAKVTPVAVGKFQASKPGLASITCRAAGPVTVTPNFAHYVEKAFIDELKLAGIYDPQSSLTLSGKLEEVDFSSGMTDGKWLFTLVVSNARNESMTTKSTFEFSGSFVADKACQEVAQAFGPAVQKLIGDVVRDPKFKQIAS